MKEWVYIILFIVIGIYLFQLNNTQMRILKNYNSDMAKIQQFIDDTGRHIQILFDNDKKMSQCLTP